MATLHEGPPGKLNVGHELPGGATSRLGLIRAFAATVVQAVRAGDMSAARVSHEAFGKLLDDRSAERGVEFPSARARGSRR
jgi:hypothetical protein